MAKNTLKKQREAVLESEQARREREAMLALRDRDNTMNFLRAVFAGALVSILVLLLLKFGVRELLSPFGAVGRRFFGAFVASGVAGGIAATLAGRSIKPPVAAGACALGWGVFGWWQHNAAVKFTSFLPGREIGAEAGRRAFAVLMNNAALQPLCVICGLLAAALAVWLINRRANSTAAMRDETLVAGEANSNDAPLILSRVLSFPLVVAALGGALMWLLGLMPLKLIAPLGFTKLPGPLSLAVVCAVISALSFGVAAYVVRRSFRGAGTVGYFVAAPLVTLFVAAITVNGGAKALLPVAALIWNSSALELAAWGSFGAVVGHWIGEVNDSQNA